MKVISRIKIVEIWCDVEISLLWHNPLELQNDFDIFFLVRWPRDRWSIVYVNYITWVLSNLSTSNTIGKWLTKVICSIIYYGTHTRKGGVNSKVWSSWWNNSDATATCRCCCKFLQFKSVGWLSLCCSNRIKSSNRTILPILQNTSSLVIINNSSDSGASSCNCLGDIWVCRKSSRTITSTYKFKSINSTCFIRI